MSEKGFCVNCNRQDCDLICEDCNDRNIKTYENKLKKKIFKDLKHKILLPYERLLKYTTEDDTVAITQMREDLKAFKEKWEVK